MLCQGEKNTFALEIEPETTNTGIHKLNQHTNNTTQLYLSFMQVCRLLHDPDRARRVCDFIDK